MDCVVHRVTESDMTERLSLSYVCVYIIYVGFTEAASGKEIACQRRRGKGQTWVRKIPWRLA